MCMDMSPKGKVICVWVCLQKARLYVYGYVSKRQGYMCMDMSPKDKVICVWIYVSKRQGYMCMGMSPKGKVICVWTGNINITNFIILQFLIYPEP